MAAGKGGPVFNAYSEAGPEALGMQAPLISALVLSSVLHVNSLTVYVSVIGSCLEPSKEAVWV